MPILGNQINNIEAKRGELERELSIRSHVEVLDVTKKVVNVIEESKDLINFKFKFSVEYSENTAIYLIGTIFYTDDEKKMADIISKWKKDKKLPLETVLPILNHAMEIGYTNAIPIAEKLRLPSPLKMPKFVPKEQEKADN